MHAEIIAKIVDEIRLLGTGIQSSEIRSIDFPFASNPPSPGVLVSPMGEIEDEASTNETTDIGYQFSVIRIRHNQSPHGGLDTKADWRKRVFKRFNRVRLGFTGELVTRIKYVDFDSPKEWKSGTLDTSGLVVTVWIREQHNV